MFGQMTNLTGHWVNNTSPSFRGFYNASSKCPDYINEFNCQNPEYYVRGQPTGADSSILWLHVANCLCVQNCLLAD